MAAIEKSILDELAERRAQPIRSKGHQDRLQALNMDLDSDETWLWLTHAVADKRSKLECLQIALELNPENTRAIEYREQLLRKPKIIAAQAEADADTDPNDMGVWLETGRLDWRIQLGRLGDLLVLSGLIAGGALILDKILLSDRLQIAIVVACVVAGLLAVIELYKFVMAFTHRVEFYEKGFVKKFLFVPVKKIRWKQVSDVTVQSLRNFAPHVVMPRQHTIHDTTVYVGEKRGITINENYANTQHLSNVIEQLSLPVLLPRYMAALHRGETVTFTREHGQQEVIVALDSISMGGITLEQRYMTRFAVVNGVLMIGSEVACDLCIRLREMPNAHVLVALAEMLIHTRVEPFVEPELMILPKRELSF